MNFDFFTNKGQEDAQVVEAPAFSLTKVLAVVAPLITALVALVTSALSTVSFSGGQITTLIVALVAFLAVTSSADVLARGIAGSAARTAESTDKAVAGRLRMLQFDAPLKGRLNGGGGFGRALTVLAASDAVPPEYLCLFDDDKSVAWQPQAQVLL